jgi:hypothetical protein
MKETDALLAEQLRHSANVTAMDAAPEMLARAEPELVKAVSGRSGKPFEWTPEVEYAATPDRK